MLNASHLSVTRWRKKSPASSVTHRSMKFDAMTSSPPPSCSMSPRLNYSERTPIAHVCEKLVSASQSRDRHQLYSQLFELHPRPSRCVIEPAYQSSRPISVRHMTDKRPIRYVRSVENDSKSSLDGVVCNEDVMNDVNSPSSTRYYYGGMATRPSSAGDAMTTLFGGGDATVTSSSSAGGIPNQPQCSSHMLISPDVVPDSDGPIVIGRIESK